MTKLYVLIYRPSDRPVHDIHSASAFEAGEQLAFHHLGCYGTVGPEYLETERGIWAPRYHTLNTDWQKHRALCPTLLSRSLGNVPSVEKRVNLSGGSLWTGPPSFVFVFCLAGLSNGIVDIMSPRISFFFSWRNLGFYGKIGLHSVDSFHPGSSKGLNWSSLLLSFPAGWSEHSLGTKLSDFPSQGSLDFFYDSSPRVVPTILRAHWWPKTFTELFSIITSP